MKQAILIGAYKNPDQLLNLINLFPDKYFNVYVHLNTIGEIKYKNFNNLISSKKNVFVYSKYKIKWGGLNHLKSLLFLANKALLEPENIFFHYITGQDLPVKAISYIIDELDKTKDYIQTVPYPVSYLPGGARDWYEYYQFYDLLDARKYLKYLRFFNNIQKKMGLRRSFNLFPKMYYGSTYWSLTRKTLQHVIDYTSLYPSFLKRLRFTFCAEEIYVPTIVLNSPFTENIINDNLRFIKWEKNGRGGSPKVLDESDWPEIHVSNKIFARKFEESNIHLILTIIAANNNYLSN